jgi:RNA polymerase sigma-70 factor (ECF subfamily)
LTKEEFKVLFDNYFDSVRSYLFYRGADTELATDLAQDVFMRVWEKQLAVDSKGLPGLLYKIAGDMFISRYRRKTLELNYRKTLKYDTDDVSPEDQLRYKELRAGYAKALAALSEKQRTVFLMARMEGLKYHEIAERLNISVKTVEKRMSAALAYLKNTLEK